MTVGSARDRHHTLPEPRNKPCQISGSDRSARAAPRA